MPSFWKRWENEYLPKCQVRKKWVTNISPLEMGFPKSHEVMVKGECTHTLQDGS